MIVTNGEKKIKKFSNKSYQIEPGYYLEGAFGIRIENCLTVQKSEIKDFLKFENLSWVPYDLNLLDFSLLQKEDILHINAYHKKAIFCF